MLPISQALFNQPSPNLSLVAWYGLLLSLARFFLGSMVGSSLDRMKLSQGPLAFLVVQNILVASSALCLAAVLLIPALHGYAAPVMHVDICAGIIVTQLWYTKRGEHGRLNKASVHPLTVGLQELARMHPN